jgi:hypothetical protein
MARMENLRRLHFAPSERHDTTAPVPPPENFPEVPPGSVRLERPAPRLQEGGFVRDRGEYSFRQGPPELAGGWCGSLTRDYAGDFQARAEHERLVRLAEALVGQEKARFGGGIKPSTTRRRFVLGAPSEAFSGFRGREAEIHAEGGPSCRWEPTPRTTSGSAA